MQKLGNSDATRTSVGYTSLAIRISHIDFRSTKHKLKRGMKKKKMNLKKWKKKYQLFHSRHEAINRQSIDNQSNIYQQSNKRHLVNPSRESYSRQPRILRMLKMLSLLPSALKGTFDEISRSREIRVSMIRLGFSFSFFFTSSPFLSYGEYQRIMRSLRQITFLIYICRC